MPVINNYDPAPGTPIQASTTIRFDVTDPNPFNVYIWVLLADRIDRLLVFNNTVFEGSFIGSSVSPIMNGLHFEVKMRPGWPSTVTQLWVEAVGASGGGGSGLVSLPLNDAVLSGGLQFKAASGGLPNRLTTQDDVLIDNCIVNQGGVMLDPTGAFVWAAQRQTGGPFAGNGVAQFDLTGVATGVATPFFGSMGIFPVDASSFIAADYDDNTIRQFDWSGNLLANMPPGSVTGPNGVAMDPADQTHVWVVAYPLGGIATEYTFPGGVATGRTLGVTVYGMWIAGGFIYITNNGTAVEKYDVATLTLQDTWTLATDQSQDPGHTYGSIDAVFVDDSGRPIVYDTFAGNIDRYLAASGGEAGAGMVDKRLVYAQPQLRGAGKTNGGLWPQYHSVGNLAAWTTSDGSNTQGPTQWSVRLMNLFGTQRARWTWSNGGGDTTLSQIFVPGVLALDRGNTYDMRKAKFFYSLDGGSTRTEFVPGSDMSVVITSGASLTLDVDIVEGDGQATNAPYIGGQNGEGPTLVFSGPVGDTCMWNITAVQTAGDTYSAAPDDYVRCDATAGNVTVVLPDATTCKGKKVGVEDFGGGNTSPGIKISTVDGQTINTFSFWFLNALCPLGDYGSAVFVSDGENWRVESTYPGHPES